MRTSSFMMKNNDHRVDLTKRWDIWCRAIWGSLYTRVSKILTSWVKAISHHIFRKLSLFFMEKSTKVIKIWLRGLAPFAHEHSLLSIISIIKLNIMGHIKPTCMVTSNSSHGKYWELNPLGWFKRKCFDDLNEDFLNIQWLITLKWVQNRLTNWGSSLFNVKSRKLVFDPDFLLWACLVPDEDPIPLIQSPKVND